MLSITTTDSHSVLSAFKALQDRIRTLDSERLSASHKAAALESEIFEREKDSKASREEYAKEEIDKLRMGRKKVKSLTETKHLIEVELAKGGERLEAYRAFCEREMERVEEVR